MRNYPLLNPPPEIVKKPHDKWTPKQAKEFFEWYIGEIEERIAILLRFINYELTGDDLADIAVIDDRITQELRTNEALFYPERVIHPLSGKLLREFELSEEGISMSHDCIRLIGKMIIAKRPDIAFSICTGKYATVDKHRPCLKSSKGEYCLFNINSRFYGAWGDNPSINLKTIYIGQLITL